MDTTTKATRRGDVSPGPSDSEAGALGRAAFVNEPAMVSTVPPARLASMLTWALSGTGTCRGSLAESSEDACV